MVKKNYKLVSMSSKNCFWSSSHTITTEKMYKPYERSSRHTIGTFKPIKQDKKPKKNKSIKEKVLWQEILKE